MRITLDGDQFELTGGLIRSSLCGHAPSAIREYWVDIDGDRWPVKQVVSLATGVADRQRFQTQAARRWLERLGFTVGRTSRRPSDRRHSTVAEEQVSRSRKSRSRKIVLIGCVKTKLAHGAPAKDLYRSSYFGKMRAYAEASGRPWFILSAEHGLVTPDAWLEPYERYLATAPSGYRRAWGARVLRQLEREVGPVRGLEVEIHAGATYVDALRPGLDERGARMTDPLHGLSIGRRLAWYRERYVDVTGSVKQVVDALADTTRATPLGDVLATKGGSLRRPGLYGWWVDDSGAADLTAGLGHPIGAGLIYAGLAGATRSGGSSSANTLWGRIATMHMGGRNEFSTLRRSLGSILAELDRRRRIDEVALSRWMLAHLRVVTVAIADAQTLGSVESEVLRRLDPPLNLAKVEKTPLRRTLAALRKSHRDVPG